MYEKRVFIIQWLDIRLRPISSKPLNDRVKFGMLRSVVTAVGWNVGYQAVTVSQRAPATEQVGVYCVEM